MALTDHGFRECQSDDVAWVIEVDHQLVGLRGFHSQLRRWPNQLEFITSAYTQANQSVKMAGLYE